MKPQSATPRQASSSSVTANAAADYRVAADTPSHPTHATSSSVTANTAAAHRVAADTPSAPARTDASPHRAPMGGTSPAPANATARARGGADVPPGTSCGAMGCRWFDTAEQALAEILKASPRVVAFGESHAQKGSREVSSSTARFTDQLLPLLKGRASDLVLELIVADGSCGKKTEEKVAEQQKPVVKPQRETNQNEFLNLGNRSKELGVRPHVLRPSCADYERIAQAGESGVPMMLAMIADETAGLVRAILDRNQRTGVGAAVLAYGGAMHNDVSPRPGMEAWSYASRISNLVGGRYVEVDLIVPEFIRDTEAWRALPWYAHFDPRAQPDKVTLFQPGPRSYVLIFPASP